MTHFVDSSNNLPRLDVLGAEFRDQPEQGKVSKVFSAVLQAISKAFSVATPKLHALFSTNYQAAEKANLAINTRVLDEVGFNNMIDHLIKVLDSLDSNKDFATIISDLGLTYMRENLSLDIRPCFTRIRLREDDGSNFTKEELKTNLLTAKFNAQSCAGGVVGLTNLARSLMTTAGMNNPGSFSNVDDSIQNTLQAHQQSTTLALDHYIRLEDALNALEDLFGHLTDQLVGRTDRSFASVQAELEARFDTFKKLMSAQIPETEFAVRGAEEADAPMLRFYQDLLKPDSKYLGLLKDKILSVRNELIEASKELDRVNREARSEKFVTIDKEYNPFRIFKGVFSVISHVTVPLNPIKSLAESSFQSLIDKSSGSKFAGIGTITLVALYIIAEVPRFVVALAAAGICMLGATVVFLGNKGVSMAGQGIQSVRDKQRPVRADQSVANQAKIEDKNRQANLLNGLRSTDFYQAYEAKLETAAMKMQARRRGNIARKAFKAKKEAATRLQAVLKRAPMMAEYRKQIAATRLQAVLKRAPMMAEYRKQINVFDKVKNALRANVARAEEARIKQAGKIARNLLASFENAFKAVAMEEALDAAKLKGMNPFASLQESRRAGEAALETLPPMFKSLRDRSDVSRQ